MSTAGAAVDSSSDPEGSTPGPGPVRRGLAWQVERRGRRGQDLPLSRGTFVASRGRNLSDDDAAS